MRAEKRKRKKKSSRCRQKAARLIISLLFFLSHMLLCPSARAVCARFTFLLLPTLRTNVYRKKFLTRTDNIIHVHLYSKRQVGSIAYKHFVSDFSLECSLETEIRTNSVHYGIQQNDTSTILLVLIYVVDLVLIHNNNR